ncbi:condensin complex subunit 2/barren [Obelidium mucronatum]|nr:condensin complex subunit 2/barren [Obelidium mucronatum]
MASQTAPQTDQRTFDEWMKIAADNKITTTNTWNLALIDYFHDLTVLREGDSINFQKASCTLDGCVKIYTSRVDSVDAETRILLNGLVDGKGGGSNYEDEEGVGKEDGKRRRQTKSGNTLEKDITALNVKKIESEFLIDPLFKKTSADFDEGTASGLLLNHLNMANEGMIIFDASDDVTVSKQMADHADTTCDSTVQMLDISKLKEKFMYDVGRLRNLSLCPSLKNFDFSSPNNEMPKFDFDKMMDTQAPGADDYVPMDHDGGDDDAGDGNGNFMQDFDDDPFPEDGGERRLSGDGGGYNIPIGIPRGMQVDDVADDENGGGGAFDLAMGTAGATEEANPFAYFDSSMVRRWAGPEHWKPKPIIKVKESAGPKKKREPMKINFGDTSITEKQLFAASTLSISMPKYGEKARAKNLLPNDEHFSAQDFLKLFLKPVNKVTFRRKNGRGSEVKPSDDVVDPAFWSQHQNDNVSFTQEPAENHFADDNDFGGGNMADDDDGDDENEPLAQDHDDLDLGAAIGANEEGTMLEYGDSLVDAPKKIKANFIHFAKTQKKVDIKKLKENLWSNLIDLTGDDDEDDEKPTPHNPSQTDTTFKNVVHGLSNRYSSDKMSDISVAFCFICLLHLANEKNLSVVNNGELNDLKIKMNT